ncbi:hypothetical protein G3W18_08325 [Klebsiella pneumoniae]|nr:MULTISPECIES: hypothetical protein [Enterobacteriaceae]EKQ3325076.1 hypothetical protein [Escherichia coli]MBC5117387.1 hypothetical protein [Klebsiella quasipneumoniae]MBR7316989.1 hypothetical protein [Klebsiella pneumoniae]HBS5783723.1 hypothetical protein [Klebsiella pneumoniae]HBT0294195.1 hypothetical protein [Klebsiella pneumoniae]
MMKKIITLSAIFIIISGCARTPPTAEQQANAFDNAHHRSNSGKIWTVTELKDDYKKITGNYLIVPEALSCGWHDVCYYNAYANAHDDGIKTFKNNEVLKRQSEQKRKEEDCRSNEKCAAKMEIDSASYTLNSIYYSLMARYPYQQADSDAGVRRMCRAAGEAERSGVSLELMKKNISLTEGIGPEMRYQIIQVAEACWTMSKYGVPDGTTQIKSVY